jgi:hypothetical protein
MVCRLAQHTTRGSGMSADDQAKLAVSRTGVVEGYAERGGSVGGTRASLGAGFIPHKDQWKIWPSVTCTLTCHGGGHTPLYCTAPGHLSRFQADD